MKYTVEDWFFKMLLQHINIFMTIIEAFDGLQCKLFVSTAMLDITKNRKTIFNSFVCNSMYVVDLK